MAQPQTEQSDTPLQKPMSSLTKLLNESSTSIPQQQQQPTDTPAKTTNNNGHQSSSNGNGTSSELNFNKKPIPQPITTSGLTVEPQVINGFDPSPGTKFPNQSSSSSFTPTSPFTRQSANSFSNNLVPNPPRNTSSPRYLRNNSISHSSFSTGGGGGSGVAGLGGAESLSSSIPYCAPGGRSNNASTLASANGANPSSSLHRETFLGDDASSTSSSTSNSHIPNLPNGQFINSIHIQSPQVNSSSIDSRFVISKQRVAQAQAAQQQAQGGSVSQRSGSQSGLSSFFSSKSKPTKRDSSTDLGSFYNNASSSFQDNNEIAGSPSSFSSSESVLSTPNFNGNPPTRHNSMSNLKRFFKKSTPTSQPSPATSNLSSSLRSGGGINIPSANAVNIPSSTANNSSYPNNSSFTTTPSNASFTNSPGASSLSISRSSTLQNKIRYQERRQSVSQVINPVQQLPFSKRYGKWVESLGAGAGGSVKLVKRLSDNKTFAVKEFRAKYQSESKRDYAKKITGEYCIGSTLKHPNIIETIEICYENERILQVMEYCDYDLFAIVMSNKMSREEINCCFKQVLSGVHYLHSIGLAHRDLKLDNCVIDARGIVKIIDFGSAVVFSYPFSKTLIEAQGIVGSDPYLAPEVCVFNKYDPRPVDVWSVAMIFCCMMLKKFPWKVPKLSDSSFKLFATRGEYVPISETLKRTPQDVQNITSGGSSGALSNLGDISEALEEDISNMQVPKQGSGQQQTQQKQQQQQQQNVKGAAPSSSNSNAKDHTSSETGADRLLLALPEDCRRLIGRMVELAPACRITMDEVFEDEWLKSVNMCSVEETEPGSNVYEVIKCDDHEHTQVDQSKAHIAAFEKNKKK
ncbi:NPR1 [Candida margitis]|uniref:NPR1 n=1 Tax=Candida margitis TaxID=1775924 RepID=UPI002227359A|nr:NPR1 [Candida margitis]KAI5969232.1 NPR1 [Candida margitis]